MQVATLRSIQSIVILSVPFTRKRVWVENKFLLVESTIQTVFYILLFEGNKLNEFLAIVPKKKIKIGQKDVSIV